MVTSMSMLPLCRRCVAGSSRNASVRNGLVANQRYTSSEPTEGQEGFDDYQAELQRRNRRAESKLRHKVSSIAGL